MFNLLKNKNSQPKENLEIIKVAMIHDEKKITTGAHHINQIMTEALKKYGAVVKNFYPKRHVGDLPIHLKGIASILFFHSLLEHKQEILKNHIIQGTTYTPLPFLSFKVPTISHFGSTTLGFLKSTPKTSSLTESQQKIFKELRDLDITKELNIRTRRPLRDIADIEAFVAKKATRCIATSDLVKEELISMDVPLEKIVTIHNAIEDYWFQTDIIKDSEPHIIFIGRLGNDVFTYKLKGLDRLVELYRYFPDTPKTSIFMSQNKKFKEWMKVAFPKHHSYVNIKKELIPDILSKRFGSILFISSRYEGFSLSLIEGMSQGLVPISFKVGVAPEIIRNGENGYLVDSVEEAKKITKRLLNNPQERLRMAEKAKETSELFKSDFIAQKLLSLYKEVRNEKRRVIGDI